jgi:hypothetical protein
MNKSDHKKLCMMHDINEKVFSILIIQRVTSMMMMAMMSVMMMVMIIIMRMIIMAIMMVIMVVKKRKGKRMAVYKQLAQVGEILNIGHLRELVVGQITSND